jgi:predicted dehydrogenase
VFVDGDTTGESFDAAELAGGSEFHIVGGFQAKHREFIDCLRTGNLPSSHFGDAVKTMAIAETILAQALMAGR